jgi:hypothetical protein
MVTAQRDIANPEDSRRKIVIVVAVIAAVVVVAVFGLLMYATSSRTSPPAKLEGAIRPGSPDWDKYSKLIVLDTPEADEAKRPLGDIVMVLRTTVRNFTGRTINGLEMRAAVVNLQGKAVKERTLILIPSQVQPELEPNKTVAVQVRLEGMKDSDDRANIKMEITAFRFKP